MSVIFFESIRINKKGSRNSLQIEINEIPKVVGGWKAEDLPPDIVAI